MAIFLKSHSLAMSFRFSPAEFYEEVSRRIYQQEFNGFDYGTVIRLTDQFQGRAMNTTMIYRAFLGLTEKGLITNIGKEKGERGRVADHFVINENGKAAFELAACSSHQIKTSRESVAA